MTGEMLRRTGHGQESSCPQSQGDASATEAAVESPVSNLIRRSIYVATGARWLGETDLGATPNCSRPFCRAVFVCAPDTREFRCTCRSPAAPGSKSKRL
jgi:hypothetical protein